MKSTCTQEKLSSPSSSSLPLKRPLSLLLLAGYWGVVLFPSLFLPPLLFLFSAKTIFPCWSQCVPPAADPTNKSSCMWTCLNILRETSGIQERLSGAFSGLFGPLPKNKWGRPHGCFLRCGRCFPLAGCCYRMSGCGFHPFPSNSSQI